MRLVTTLNLQCVRISSIRLKPVERVAHPDSGQLARRRCSQSNTKPKAAGTETNDDKTTKVPEGMDEAKVAHEEWQAKYPRPEGNWRTVSAIKSYQSIVAPRICGNYEE